MNPFGGFGGFSDPRKFEFGDTRNFGSRDSNECFGTPAKPVIKEINASLHVFSSDVNYADNSVTSVDKTTTLVDLQAPFEKDAFAIELNRTINTLIKILDTINDQKSTIGGSKKKHTLTINLTYHE